MKKSKVVKAAAELMDAMKPVRYSSPTPLGWVGKDLDQPLTNLMIALDRWSDPQNTFHGNGLYLAGEAGIALADNIETITEEWDEEDEEREDILFIEAAKGAVVSITEVEGKTDCYEVIVIRSSDKEIPIECSAAEEDKFYYGSYHSIFDSGDTSLIYQY